MPRTSRKGRKVYRGGQFHLGKANTDDPSKTVIFAKDYNYFDMVALNGKLDFSKPLEKPTRTPTTFITEGGDSYFVGFHSNFLPTNRSYTAVPQDLFSWSIKTPEGTIVEPNINFSRGFQSVDIPIGKKPTEGLYTVTWKYKGIVVTQEYNCVFPKFNHLSLIHI